MMTNQAEELENHRQNHVCILVYLWRPISAH